MEEDECCDGHCCHDETDESCCEEMSTEDLVESNQIILSALIEVLQRKGLLTQEELEKEIETIQSEDDEDEDDDEDETEEGGAEGEKAPVVETDTEAADDGVVPNTY